MDKYLKYKKKYVKLIVGGIADLPAQYDPEEPDYPAEQVQINPAQPSIYYGPIEPPQGNILPANLIPGNRYVVYLRDIRYLKNLRQPFLGNVNGLLVFGNLSLPNNDNYLYYNNATIRALNIFLRDT